MPWRSSCRAGRDAGGKRQYRHVHVSPARRRQQSDRQRAASDWGVTPGTRIALLVRPGMEFISLVFALFKAGAVIVLIDPGMGRKNLIRCLAEVQPEGFVAIPLVHAVRTLLRHKFPPRPLQRDGRPAAVLGWADARRSCAGAAHERRFATTPRPTIRRRSFSPPAAPARPRECSIATAISIARSANWATFTAFSRAKSICPAFRCSGCSTARWA